jgi:fibronectin-binding autotransporter adhesin
MQRHTAVGRDQSSIVKLPRFGSAKAARASAAPLTRWVCCMLALAAVIAASSPASAVVLTWDAGGGGGAVTDGAGTWGTAGQWQDATNNPGVATTWSNSNPDDALIGNGGAGGAITGGAVTAGSITFNSFTGTYTLSSGSLALNNGLTINSGAGAVTVSSPVTLGGAQAWTNNATSLLTASGSSIALGSNQLTVNGSGNTTISAAISGLGSLVVNPGASSIVTLSNTGSSYSGGTTLSSGTLVFTGSSGGGPPSTSGPLGIGTLTLNGGILSLNGTNTISNSVTVGGTSGLDTNAGSTSVTFTLSGPVAINSGAILNYTNSGLSNTTGSKHVMSGLVTLSASPTVNINSTVGSTQFVQWNGGIDLNNADRTVTVNGTGTLGMQIGGTLKDTGGSGHNLTLNGNKTVYSNLIAAGTGNPGLIYSGTGTMDLQDKASTWTGGFTLNSGTAIFAASSTVTSGAVVSGPFGTGTITLNGGSLIETNTSQTLHNNLVLGGSVTIASIANPGNTLAFNPTTVTSPSAGAITVNGAVTIKTNHNTLTLTGPITGINTPSLTIKGSSYGLGTVTLTNLSTTTASTFGNLYIGDSVASGSLGGRVQISGSTANMQKELGAGDIAINYGGFLNYGNQNGDLNPTNAITVNNGGTFAFNTQNSVAMTNSMTFNSGARLDSGNKTLTLNTATASFPNAGVFFVTGNQTTTVTGAYPSLAGTMAFGGATSGGTTTFTATTLSSAAGSARTVAFNQTGGGNVAFSGGLTLNANLTVAGTGNVGLTGTVPWGGAGGLGAVTQDAGRSITVAMAPTGAVSITGSATGWANTNINSGTLLVNTTGALGSGTVTLNGGILLPNGITYSGNLTIGSAGGTLESDASNGVNYSGALTGNTGGLVLRSIGKTLRISGNNNAFTGGFTLAVAGGSNTCAFNFDTPNANSLGGTTNTITVPKGISFGGAQVTRANISKFITNVDSILVPINAGVEQTPDLSSSGLNIDVWIGLNGQPITSYTLPSSGANTTNYKIVPMFATTLATTNLFNGANNLIVSASQVPTDSNSSATALLGGVTLTNSNSQSYTGTTLITGVIKNSLMGGGVQGTTLSTGAGLTGTSGITVDNGATLTLTGGTSGAASAPITVKGGGAINVNASSVLTSTDTLALGGATGGGTYAASGAQTLAGLTVAAGSNAISGTGILNITGGSGGGYTRNVGGVLNDTQASTYGTAPTAAGGSGVAGTSSPILIGAYNSSTAGAGNFIAAATTFANPTYTLGNDLSTWANDKNIQILAAATNSIADGLTINSLYSSFATTAGFGAGTNTLTIASGMVLDINVNFSIGASAGSGKIRTGNGQDLILIATGSTLTVNSTITADSGGVTRALTVNSQAATGAPVVLTSINNVFSDVYLNSGYIRVDNGAGSLGTGGTINLLGGGGLLLNSNNQNYSNAYSIYVGPKGGSIQGNLNTVGTPQNFSMAGAITLNGALMVNAQQGNSSPQTATLSGDISGPGVLIANGPQSNNTRDILILSGNNSNFSGGIRMGIISTGVTAVRLDNANAAGTGPIVATGGNNQLFFTNNVVSANLANDIIGVNTLANWATLTPVALSGKLLNTGGLNVQGYAAGGAASELVLAGTTSVSGSPLTYNWSSTPTSSVQNFVNGQGGITAGSTGFIGGALTAIGLTGALGAAQNIDSPAGGSLTQGDLGFVRFSGANSFIPGAVGPGYIAAIHQASDTTNYGNGAQAVAPGGANGSTGGANGLFGFGLTGGSTYTLPEGKSFVIGSLGNSVNGQTGGTLYATDNTAILVGSPKLSGFAAGDVNIHANAAGDTQTLSLSAKNLGDTLQIGTTGTAVVFTPTCGDSGYTSAITLMADRTGSTTIKKTGAGTVEFKNAAFQTLNGASIRNKFNVEVNAGTLKYSQADSGSDLFNSFSVNPTGNLTVGGTLKSPVTLNGGTLTSGGASTGAIDGTTNVIANSSVVDGGAGSLTAGDITTASSSAMTVDTSADLQAKNISGLGSTTVNGSLTADSIVQNTLTIGAGGSVTIRETTGGNVSTVPEPGTWVLIGAALMGWLVFRRRHSR